MTIAPFRVIPPLSELPIDNAPISVPVPIAATDAVPVPASIVTVSTLTPPIAPPTVMFPPVAPVSIFRFAPFASSIFAVANSILSAAVVNATAVDISMVASLAAVKVVPPSNL